MAPDLTLMRQNAPQRDHRLRDVFDAVRWLVRTGVPWRFLPGNFPPWQAVDQQARRPQVAGVFEAMAHDLRGILRLVAERKPDPTGVILATRTLQSTPESGGRAGDDGHKCRQGARVHAAVNTLGHMRDRSHAGVGCNGRQRTRARPSRGTGRGRAARDRPFGNTGRSVTLAYVDQGDSGKTAAEAAKAEGIEREVVKHTQTKKGFVLLPRRWVEKRRFAWSARFRRLARDDERLATTLADWHWLAFVSLLPRRRVLSRW